jgi:ABC-type branched-subunit amino acid transport system permease subunit
VKFFIGTEFLVPSTALTSLIEQYYLGLVMTNCTIFGIYLLMRSRIRYPLKAIGEYEFAFSSLGVNILLFKSIALLAEGLIASIAGTYFLKCIGSINSTIFLNWTYSLFPMFRS